MKLSPIGNTAQFINGIPANGAKIFTYVAGSSTKQTTYTDEGGLTQQTNPIILDSRGEPSQPIWLIEGASYKIVFAPSTDSDPPVSPIWDVDDVTGINDASVSIDQWVDSGLTPTYVSATSFTVPGDQTSIFTNKRRIKATVTAGTAYGTILTSVFGALTTVTVVMDSTPLDSGLSAMQIGLITPNNTSLPSIVESFRATVAATATTTPLWASTAQVQDWTGTPTITNFPAATRAGIWRTVYPATGTVITDNANIDVQGDSTYTTEAGDKLYIEALTTTTSRVWISKKTGAQIARANKGGIQDIDASVGSNILTITVNPCVLDFRSTTLTDGTPTTVALTSAVTVAVPNTATLGTVNAIEAQLGVLAINNAGTIEAAVVNLAGGVQLDETNLITTTTIGTGADSATVAYSTTGRASVAYRVLGYINITEATAGTWATAPTLVQGVGGQVKANSVSMVRLYTANGYGSTNTVIRRFTTTLVNQGSDITYADSVTLGGTFTVVNAGVYAITHSYGGSANYNNGLSLNSTQLTTNIVSINIADVLAHTANSSNNASMVSWCGYLVAGSVVRAHGDAGATSGSVQVTFTMTRVG